LKRLLALALLLVACTPAPSGEPARPVPTPPRAARTADAMTAASPVPTTGVLGPARRPTVIDYGAAR
jgi:hypothetical protein